MKLFEPEVVKSTDILPFALNSGAVTIRLPKTGLIGTINLIIEGTIGTAATAASVDGLAALIQSIVVRGNRLAGGQIPFVNSVSGAGMRELQLNRRGILPRVVGALSSTGWFRLSIPLDFMQPFFPDRLGYVTNIDAYNFNELIVQITPATTAQVDTNSAFVLTSAITYCECQQAMRASIPDDLILAQTIFEQVNFPTPNSGTNIQLQLPAGGHYANILMRAFSAANVKQVDGGSTPFVTGSNAQALLLDLLRNNKEETDYQAIRDVNAFESATDSIIVGNACYTFNRALNKLFFTGQKTTAADQIQVKANLTGAANARIEFVTERILDLFDLLKIQ